jgi:fimbrial chaperone protein
MITHQLPPIASPPRRRSSLRTMLRLLALAMTLGAAATPAQAYRVEPMSLELESAGRGAQGAFRVINDGTEPVAIEVRLAARSLAEDGTETLSAVGDQFILFPTQMILRPGQSQAVRVQWKADANLPREQNFRIITEQLPVNLQRERAGGAQIGITLRYQGTLYVRPDRAKAAVAVQEARVEPAPGGGSQLALLLANNGTRHAILGTDLKVTVRAGKETVTLEGEKTGAMLGANLLAGNKRRFVVPLPAALPAGAATVTLDYETMY